MFTPRQKTFVKAMQRSSQHDASYRSFEHFCEMAYCALAKPMAPKDQADACEARYMKLVEVVGPDRTREFADLLGAAALDIHETGDDFLGAIFQSDEVRAQNRDAGQFFTPPDVCRMMAAMTVGDLAAQLKERPYLKVCEPAAGAGGMVLAVAAVARSQGVEPATCLWFDATDVATVCYHMTVIQLSLAGLSGIVRHGNTLTLEQWDAAVTMPSMHFLSRHGWPAASDRPSSASPVEAEPSHFPPAGRIQLGLFDEDEEKIA